MEASSCRKYVELPFKYKQLICVEKLNNPKISQRKLKLWVKQKFGYIVTQKTISNILSNSKEYLQQKSVKTKQFYPKFPIVEKLLYDHIVNHQDSFNISGSYLKKHAKELAKIHYPNCNFSASNGWLQNFKNRSKIHLYKGHGESASVDYAAIRLTRPILHAIIANYPIHNIFNIDETRLFYKKLVSS
jgi:hypothetical protein